MTRHIITIISILILTAMPICSVYAAQGKNLVATQKGKVGAKAGETVKCEYFTVAIPAGWEMPDPVKRKPPVFYAAFSDIKSGIAITYNILDLPMQAKELAEITVKNMKASGLKTGQLKKTGNFYRLSISGKINGEAWFASNGKICTATIILGEIMDKKVIDSFLKVFKPVDPAMFPRAM